MLNDNDKITLLTFAHNNIALAKSGLSREEIVAQVAGDTFRLLKNLPDVCAAEIDDYFLNPVLVLADITRLIVAGKITLGD